jgi:hypothetical protein
MVSNTLMRNLAIAAVLLLGLWALDRTRTADQVWVYSVEGKGPARILRFYASTGAATPGQQVQLCYAVENARSVVISPLVRSLYPSHNYCLAVAPEHTTHFTLMAEGFDGTVAARSFTLPVQVALPVVPVRVLSVAAM